MKTNSISEHARAGRAERITNQHGQPAATGARALKENNTMGEYANYNGHSIKIGTCENMYYLRYDQRHLVDKEPNSLDPSDESIIGEIRFRFPFPDEDHNEPGAFDDYDRSLPVSGCDDLLEGVDHGTLQFTRNYPHSGGIILSTPCPESAEGKASGLKFQRNGCAGSVRIVQQRRIGAELWTVCECGSCGAKFRLPAEEAERLAVALRSEAGHNDARRLHVVADRILAGYQVEKAAA